ncbi:MAG TPA: cbb3-type cytochrome c oxidase subunit I [Nevskiaceae bacterium]
MSTQAIVYDLIGRFTMHSLPFYNMLQDPTKEHLINGSIGGFAACVATGGLIIVVLGITYLRKWRYLWAEWFTSTDQKKIAIMYMVITVVMLARAIIEAILMRGQQAWGLGGGFLSPDHMAQLFTTHGTIMIFFMVMPFIAAVINYIMPLQIGARDVSFPVMNSVSLWLTAAGAILVMTSLVFGQFSTGGWFEYPPYTETTFLPGVGPDYWIWAVLLSGVASTMTGINFAVTILKERAPGMKLFRMPLFTWAALCTAIMMVFAMPALTVAAGQLALDRYLGFHFFTNGLGGNQMMFANEFWLFGHPEVYILIIPSFGIYSEVAATFSGKALFGYKSMVFAIMVIAIMSFTVWLHHFFTMGQNGTINAVFGIASMVIGIPTGVKIYDWMWTMFRGRVRFTTPLIYLISFIVLFVLGGMSGILLANPSVDYQVHNTLFLVAHFHNVIIPGVLFGLLAGYHYWFPKVFGYRLHEGWGRFSAFCWIFGFMAAFFPLYALGMMGLPRRTVAYALPIYQPWEMAAFGGALLIGLAVLSLFIQAWVSWRHRDENRVTAGDPWDGRSLEWACSAPPPEYNFAVIPTVTDRDAFTVAKEFGAAYLPPPKYFDITMPRNAAIGPLLGVFGFGLAFGLVWHIWWLASLCTLCTIVVTIARGFVRRTTKVIPATEVQAEHERWLATVRATPPVTRAVETRPANQGLADQTALRAAP